LPRYRPRTICDPGRHIRELVFFPDEIWAGCVDAPHPMAGTRLILSQPGGGAQATIGSAPVSLTIGFPATAQPVMPSLTLTAVHPAPVSAWTA
jgi:hypothetical protein